jgi:acyl carrier protein
MSHPTAAIFFKFFGTELCLPPQQLSSDTALTELDDSLEWFELLLAVENEFDVQISEGKVSQMRTLGDLLACVESLRDVQSQAVA